MSETCQHETFTNTLESTVQCLFIALLAQLVDLLPRVLSSLLFSQKCYESQNAKIKIYRATRHMGRP